MEFEVKEHRLLKDIFQTPQDSFDLFLNQKLFSRFEIFKIHFTLILLAPVFKLLTNLFQIFVLSKFINLDNTIKVYDGILGGFLFFTGVLFFVYHLDILLAKLRAGDTDLELVENKDIFLLSFLPFSASALFYSIPKPFNFLLILISFIYSIQLSYLSMKTILYFSLKQILVFILYIFILILIFSTVFLTIFKWAR